MLNLESWVSLWFMDTCKSNFYPNITSALSESFLSLILIRFVLVHNLLFVFAGEWLIRTDCLGTQILDVSLFLRIN